MIEATKETGKIYFGTNSGPGPQTIMVATPEGRKYLLKHVCRHSPDGFQWGYGGSGPADAALSILHDCVGKEDAEILYYDFKWTFIAKAGIKLMIMEKKIQDWIKKKKAEFQKERKNA